MFVPCRALSTPATGRALQARNGDEPDKVHASKSEKANRLLNGAEKMNILSYRGPGMAGGVSSALALLWTEHDVEATWWHLSGSVLHATDQLNEPARILSTIPQAVIDGHYRYCNEFLWPVMHDLPQYARYSEQDHKFYITANRMLARLAAADKAARQNPVFVQDYQMAIMPELLAKSGMRSLLFWHIPWPARIAPKQVRQLVQIARGLLSAEVLGFHTAEYAQNFLRFVHRHFPGTTVDFARGKVSKRSCEDALPWTSGLNSRAENGPGTTVITAPLGIDPLFWRSSASIPQLRLHTPEFSWLHSGTPYVLSVDRADYTKGVADRIRAIDSFFQRNPEKVGKVNFVQVCGRTRPGLAEFDHYWQKCKDDASNLQSKWSTPGWSPMIWVEKPCTGSELSVLYRDASVMMVNPVRDGLNLTAKEFVASQIRNPGVLALSDGAGAWHELAAGSVRLRAEDHEQMASAVELALRMGHAERSARIHAMNSILEQNTLCDWWKRITEQLSAEATADSTASLLSARPS